MKSFRSIVLLSACISAIGSTFGATNDISGALQRGLFEEEANHNFQAALQAYQSAVESYDQSRKLAATAVFRLAEVYRKLGQTNEATAQYQRLVRDFSDQSDLVASSQKFLGAVASAATETNNPPKRDLDAEEIQRLQKLIVETPDLLNAGSPGTGRTPLHRAAQDGQLVVVQFLLTNVVNVNVRDSAGKTALTIAVERGRIDSASLNIISALLKAHADADIPDYSGQTPLHVAAYTAYKPGLDLLLASGANPNRQALNGATPLHYAVIKGFRTGIEALLKHGADPNLLAQKGPVVRVLTMNEEVNIKAEGTPLHLATAFGYPAVAETLLNGGASVNAVNNPFHATPLHLAIFYRQPAIAKLLLENKATVNAQTSDGSTALFQAAANADLELVKLLLSNHADPKIANNGQTTPLHRILENSRSAESTNIISLLLDAGADPNSPDSIGRTPLLVVNYEPPTPSETLAATKLLLDRGANVDAVDRDEKMTSLVRAVKNANLPLVKLLLANHANPSLITSYGLAALHYLCGEQYRHTDAPEIAKALIAAGANVNEIGRDGRTPLAMIPKVPGPFAINAGSMPIPLAPPRPIRPANAPSSQGPPEAEPLRAVLIQNGALEQMPDFSRVKTARGTSSGSGELIKDDKNSNHFTLFELIGQEYLALGSPPGLIRVQTLSFPDLTAIKIVRPSRSDLKSSDAIPTYIVTAQDTFDCSRDVELKFGDRVEIPEREHSLGAINQGLTEAQLKSLKDCLQRTVILYVRGQPQDLKLAGTTKDTYLSLALRLPEVQALLRNTSNLSAVKVSRLDPQTNTAVEYTEDVLAFWNGPKPLNDDLWLRAGDKIEISEKH